MTYTSFDEIQQIHTDLHKTFKSRVTIPLEWRQHQILQVARMVQENHEKFAEAISKDLNKPAFEIYLCEINGVMERCLLSAQRLPEWAKVENREDAIAKEHQKSWKPRVYREPKGVGVVIAPWNYPLILSLQPLLGAIAAGCCCVIKPSEVAAHYANVLAELVPKYLDPSAFRVVLGAVSETTKLLELKWDHIFYTGNGTVARIISAAAAKHLTPVTLELGGKSPVIIDPNFNSPNTCGIENLSGLALAAKRIFWGKTSNAGQICVSPDYVLLPTKGNPKAKEELEEGFKQAYKESFPQESPLDSASYSKMINENHYKRVERLLDGSKGRVVCGGGKDEKKVRIEPTVLFDVGENDTLMEGENFGPVLPVLDVGTVEDAIEFVRKRDHPLVLYVFSDDEEFKRKVRENTTSGGIVFNDTFIQLDVNEMPFGGVGESGQGLQVLRYTYEEFSYQRSSLEIPKELEQMFALRYPPYSQQSFDIMCKPGLEIKIPETTPTSGLKV